MRTTVIALSMCLASSAYAADISVPMNLVDGKGTVRSIGSVLISESPYGVVFTPALEGLPPGIHGFHIHENGSCAPKENEGKVVPALSAGGHYDPRGTKRHGTPWGDGHLGDLPALAVTADGKASNPVLAPRLKMENLKGRSVMIHVGSDNHADHPAPLGGGGARIACGVIQG